jgi:hypothetical protein
VAVEPQRAGPREQSVRSGRPPTSAQRASVDGVEMRGPASMNTSSVFCPHDAIAADVTIPPTILFTTKPHNKIHNSGPQNTCMYHTPFHMVKKK